MDAGVADVFQTVEYSRDKWTMEKVPHALLFCFVGIAFVGYIAPGPPFRGIVLAVIALLGMVVIFLFVAILYELIFEGRTTVIRLLAAALAIICLTALYWNRPGALLTPRYPRGPHVPPNVFGWMAIIGAVAWIVFALYRHFRPARPMLVLSPAGISYHGALVRNLLIPWHEIQGVDGLEYTGASGIPYRFPNSTAVLISREFYDQHILVQRSVLRGPTKSWNNLFVPKESSSKDSFMQMVLHHQTFAIDAKDIREPVEARWKAFRSGPPSAPGDAKPIAAAGQGSDKVSRQVYGAWSIDGSLWQAIKFLVPIIGIVAILADSTGIWR
jgi:hypothetical protein